MCNLVVGPLFSSLLQRAKLILICNTDSIGAVWYVWKAPNVNTLCDLINNGLCRKHRGSIFH